MTTFRTVTVAAVAVLATASPATASTPDVQVGWSRWHTQHVLCSTGTRVVMSADENGRRHLVKDYGTVTVTYVGPPRRKPYVGPYRVEEVAVSP